MKSFLLSLMITISSSAFAVDLALKHAPFCDSKEVKSINDDKDSCRIMVTTSDIGKTFGVCKGYMDTVPCEATYLSDTEELVAIQIICGKDPQSPAFEKIFEAEAVAYKVSAVVTTKDGRDVIINDPSEYTYYGSSFVNVAKKDDSFVLSLNMDVEVELERVSCH